MDAGRLGALPVFLSSAGEHPIFRRIAGANAVREGRGSQCKIPFKDCFFASSRRDFCVRDRKYFKYTVSKATVKGY